MTGSMYHIQDSLESRPWAGSTTHGKGLLTVTGLVSPKIDQITDIIQTRSSKQRKIDTTLS